MKKILALVIAAVSLLALSTSCQKYGYGTYTFVTNYETFIRDASREAIVLNTIQQDSYFFTKHEYKGTLDECVQLAAAEFDLHVKALDNDTIKSQLLLDEYVRINLWSMDPGQRWLSYRIRSGGLLLDGE